MKRTGFHITERVTLSRRAAGRAAAHVGPRIC